MPVRCRFPLLFLLALALTAHASTVAEAHEHFRAGRFHECLAILEHLPESARDAGVLNMLGASYAQVGRASDAQSAFRSAIARFPGHLAAYQNLGAFLLERNANQEAIQVLTPAVSRFPKSHDLIRSLGIACQRAGKFEEARTQFRRLPDSDALIGNSFLESGDYASALAALKDAAARHPDEARISYLLGLAHTYLGDATGARKVLSKTLELDPRFCLAYHQLAKVELDASDASAALTLSQQAIACDPRLAAPHYLMSRIHSMRGNAAESEKEMRLFLSLRIDPKGMKP
jgi:protein O-GlcNAc transferase